MSNDIFDNLSRSFLTKLNDLKYHTTNFFAILLDDIDGSY